MDAERVLDERTQPLGLGWRVTPFRLAALLLVVALAVRMVGLGLRPFWLDEAYSAWFASRSWHELWTIVPTYEPHPPFYYSLLKLWRDLFGGSAVALRGLSVLLSVLTVPVVIAAANELERQRPSGRPLLRAGIAGFFAACSPMLILVDQEARPYPLLILAYAVAMLGVLRLLRELGERTPGRWTSWIMLGFGTELTLWAHGLGAIYALCLAAALAPAWLKRPVARGRLARGFATAAAVALLYAPCLAMMMNRAGDWGSGWLQWDAGQLLQLIRFYSVPSEVTIVVAVVAALAMLLLMKRAVQYAFQVRGWTGDKAILLLWWGPPLIAIAVSVLVIPIFLPRTLVATLVPAYLAIAGALAHSDARQDRLALSAALVFPLLVGAVQAALRPPFERWDLVSAYLRQHIAPGDRVWLYPNDSLLPLREAGVPPDRMHGVPGDYPATGFKGPIRAGSPAVVSLTAAQAERTARDPTLRSIPTIWLVTRQSELFDPKSDLTRALAEARRPGKLEQWGYIEARPYYAR